MNIGDLVRHSSVSNLTGIITEKIGMVFTVLWLDNQGGFYDYDANEIEVVKKKEQ